MSLEQVCRFAADAGFSCVELMCWPPGKAERRYAGVTHLDVDRPEPPRPSDGVRALLDADRRFDLRRSDIIPTSSRPTARRPRSRVAHLRKVIDASAVLGVTWSTSFVGRDPKLSVDDNWPRFLETWRPLVRHAEEQGVRVGIENCPMLFTADEWPGGKNLATTPAIWRRMFADIPSPNFGLNYDPSHIIWQHMDYIAPHRRVRRPPRSTSTPRTPGSTAHAPRRPRHPGLPEALAHAQDPRPGRRPLGPPSSAPSPTPATTARSPSRSRTGPSKAPWRGGGSRCASVAATSSSTWRG